MDTGDNPSLQLIPVQHQRSRPFDFYISLSSIRVYGTSQIVSKAIICVTQVDGIEGKKREGQGSKLVPENKCSTFLTYIGKTQQGQFWPTY